MPIDYDFRSINDSIADESLIGVEIVQPRNDFCKHSIVQLEDEIQRYKKLLFTVQPGTDTSKIKLRLKALEAEKARRGSRVCADNAAPAVQGKDKSDEQKPTQQRVYFDRVSTDSSSARPASSEETLKIMRIPKKRKLATAAENGVVGDAEPISSLRPCARKRLPKAGGTLDSAVVLDADSDDGHPAEVKLEPARRLSARLAQQRLVDQDHKIAYPSSDDPEAVEVYYRDLKHVAPMEYLNDTVIDFYIKYLQHNHKCLVDGDHKVRFYFFNSFFYKKLGEAFCMEAQQEAFSKLRKWTKGVDIFEKSYLFVPINDKFHWSLAIICFSTPQDDGDKSIPFIYHLDSLDNGHASRGIFKLLRRYLEMEHEHTHSPRCVEWQKAFTRRVEVPRQDNEYDCGIFLLYYIKCFLDQAVVPCKLTEESNKNMFGRRWFRPVEASRLRMEIKDLLQKLFNGAD